MARREKKPSEGPKQTWLITFGDLVTLLLTFFVLLLTMASMDKSFLTRVSVFTKDMGVMNYKGAGKVPQRVRLAVELIDRPEDMLLNRERIKDLLFPDDLLPPGIDRGTLEENLRILERPEGVALVLSDRLLFEPGRAKLSRQADALLTQVGYVLQAIPAPVNISGYTDSTGSASYDNFALGGKRAMSVLKYFLERDFPPTRFSLSTYGALFPVDDNATARGRERNRRVEILLKNRAHLGAYS